MPFRLTLTSPFQTITSRPSIPILRIDHKANLVVERDSDRPLTPTDLKAKGNKHFGLQEYEQAVDAYRSALKLLGGAAEEGADNAALAAERGLRVALNSNAAEALLRMERAFEAREAARAALALEPAHAKARFRLGTAELHLRRYAAAEGVLAPLLEELEAAAVVDRGTVESVKGMLDRARRRAADARGDFYSTYDAGGAKAGEAEEEAEEEGRRRHLVGRLEAGDVGGYVHPAVTIRQAGLPDAAGVMKGRGLFVGARVSKGGVLLVEWAVAHVAEGEKEKFGFQVDLWRGPLTWGATICCGSAWCRSACNPPWRTRAC